MPQGFLTETPQSASFPEGLYEAVIEELRDEPSSTGKRMFALVARIVGGDYDGWPYYENYVIGTRDDPDGVHPKSWKRLPAINLRKLLEKAQVPISNDMDAVCLQAVDQHVVLDLIEYEDEGGEGREQYKGQMRNRVRRYYAVGEVPTGTATAASPWTAPAQAAGRAAKPNGPDDSVAEAAAPPAPVGRRATVPSATCGLCGVAIPRPTFARHVEECAKAHAGKTT
jgi:hypothetical protein